MNSVRHLRRSALLSSILAVFLLSSLGFSQDKDWRPVSSADLSSTNSVVEPNADAEAILWEVRVNDASATALVLEHYVRIKIYTEKGRDDFAKRDLLFTKGMKIKEIKARVTKPDSSVFYLKDDDVMERDIVKASGVKVRAKSFALPGIEVGSIIEFKYREVLSGSSATMRLMFQRDIPIREISYYVKPFSGDKAMYYEQFNVGDAKFEKDKGGFYRVTMRNVPAFREEPFMLPEDDVLSWIYIFYSYEREGDPEKYWRSIGKGYYEVYEDIYKADKAVKAKTQEVIAGATTDEEKLRRIFDFTRHSVRNLTYSENVTEKETEKAWKSRDGGDVLKLMYGSSTGINRLFGSMAKAAGFDVRPALSGDRSELSFKPNVLNASLMLNSLSVAVKSGNEWKLFSPGNYYTPYGLIGWYKEGQQTLVADPDELIWIKSPLPDAKKSAVKRTGTFKLLADGSLEGEATVEYTGHWADYNKRVNQGESATEREDRLKSLLSRNVSASVELKSFSIENADDPDKSFIYKFKIRVPNYGAMTGSRIFFVPNVFNNQTKPLFTAAERKYDVYFSYPWAETDEIYLELPEGYALENADAPQSIKDQQGIGSHVTDIGVTKTGNKVVYKRDFSFGNGGLIRFPAGSYSGVKRLFEAFHSADVHQLTIKKNTTAVVNTQ